jgi:uncharacterized protein (TIGR00369 family)
MTGPQIALPAYARMMGIEVDRWENGRPLLAVDCREDICGHPGMFHGGALGALLEQAALAVLKADLQTKDGASALTPLSSTIEYLRAAVEKRTFATAEIVRSGRRLANVRAFAWQESLERPAAIAFFNIAIKP